MTDGRKYELIIGIDPDVERSGFAVVSRPEQMLIDTAALTFPEILERIAAYKSRSVLVAIEDSDNAANWHYSVRDRAGVIAAKGRSVGMCHATIRHLRECVEAAGLPVRMQPPFRKCWRGAGGKLSQAEAQMFLTGLPARCNQECRDAALIAWLVAEFPIRIKSRL